MQRRLASRTSSRLCSHVSAQSRFGVRSLTFSSKCLQVEKPFVHDSPEAPNKAETSSSSSSTSQLPWYLRENASSPQNEAPKIQLPDMPQNAPDSLLKMVELMGLDYGLDNIRLFDLTSLDDHHPFSSKNHLTKFIVIGSGKSPKHIQKAANELRGYIKHTYGVIAPIEGLISSLISPVERRRLLRRARKGPMATDKDYGRLPNSWVMFDTGVDGIHIHMMTPDRRRELQLESMYSPDYDPEAEIGYGDDDADAHDSDNIFIGIRRGFHTMTAFTKSRRALHNPATTQSAIPHSAHENLAVQAEAKAGIHSAEMNSISPKTHIDFIAEFELRKAAHLVNPETVTLQDVESILLEKNASWTLALSRESESDAQLKEDVVRFIKLLIDSPETKLLSQSLTVGEQADELLDRVSLFMNKVLRFSSPTVDMFVHPQFVVLLWRLILRQISSQYISVATVDAAIASGNLIDARGSVSELASNRARDLIFLSAQYAEENGVELSQEYKELVLFAYGNDNNWSAFWDTWDRYFGMRAGETHESNDLVTKWTRLATYLAIRANNGAAARFFGVHWHRSKSIGVTFLHDYEISGNEFASETQLRAFLRAVERLLLVVLEQDDIRFAYVRRTLNALESQLTK